MCLPISMSAWLRAEGSEEAATSERASVQCFRTEGGALGSDDSARSRESTRTCRRRVLVPLYVSSYC